ncbi:MAG: doxx family protein [Flavobacteriales bacterium]|nr:doxx family protein [Flavobacteriales bacterium]MCB9167643.1 doxx family protein [Flavobacteriales bacterium]
MNLVRAIDRPRSRRTALRITPLLYLRLSIGLCFLWFGALKLVPGLSPAEFIAERTIATLTLGLVHGTSALVLLALLEMVLGAALVFRIGLRPVLFVLMGHMLCTLAPMVLFPGEVFTHVPYGLTLLGQYIIKNFVIMSGAWIVLQNLDAGPSMDRTHAR